DNVRLYYFASTQHGPAATPSRGICQQLGNPLSYQETQRALLAALQGWVSTGNEPPPSQFPRLGDGMLVAPLPQATQGFPIVPGVRYNGKLNHLFVNDQSVQPPRHVPGTEYSVLVPRVDANGNEIGGVRSTSLQVPLGTHSGWNLRAAGFMEDEPCYLTGAYVPFASTRAERLVSGDPRLSFEERYASQQAYVDAVGAAARNLVAQRLLLPEDAERAVKDAESAKLGLGAEPPQLWGVLTPRPSPKRGRGGSPPRAGSPLSQAWERGGEQVRFAGWGRSQRPPAKPKTLKRTCS
ncbi:MAG TPA: alpha/beta hydrolase domain-containing protein, partial [Chloroflexota bacterium]|nr:alpha/beta hydrolase domain-containing protein [Chloroflexota bacterium]